MRALEYVSCIYDVHCLGKKKKFKLKSNRWNEEYVTTVSAYKCPILLYTLDIL